MLKNILVTGGCGFVGSHLVENLMALGHNVTILDRCSSEKKTNLPAKLNLVKGDIRDDKLLRELLKNSDICFHLAAVLSPESYDNNLDETRQVNFLATNSLFEIAASL